MPRGKIVLSASAAIVALVFAFAAAPVGADHHLVGAVDDTTPLPPSNVMAQPDLEVPSVDVTWDLSLSDESYAVGTTGIGSMGQNVTTGQGVTEYILRRGITTEDREEIARVPAGQRQYIDTQVESGSSYEYSIAAFDGTTDSAAATAAVTLGAPPVLVIDRFSVDFIIEDLAPGTFSRSLVNITNTTASDAFLQFDYDPTSGFVVTDGDDIEQMEGVRFSLVNVSALFGVTFDPAEVGNFNGTYTETIVLTTNEAEPNTYDLPVSATINVADGEEAPRVDASALAFGLVEVGGVPGVKALAIANAGGADLTITTIVSSSANFVVGTLPAAAIGVGGTGQVEITFTPTANEFYDETLTITSDDPDSPTVVAVTGLGRPAGEGAKRPSRKIVKGKVTFPIDIDFGDPVAVSTCQANAAANIQANLAAGLLVTNVTCSLGSTIVDFEIVADPAAAEPPVITEEAALAELITIIEDPEVEVFVDLVDELGTVESVVDETETVVAPQPTDALGNELLGWFSLTGTRIDLEDFNLFADEFGKSVTSDRIDAFDIAGPDQGPPDGVINFNDFFRFSDDYGKTVANADAVRSALGL